MGIGFTLSEIRYLSINLVGRDFAPDSDRVWS
jgi:hypothetical protein